MTTPKTADQINSQVLGKVEIAKQITHDGAACGCEAFSANKFTKGKACEHIKAVVDYEKKRLGL